MHARHQLVLLSSLRAGQKARVCRILGQPEHVHRLEEFGLRRDAVIEVFRSGNPCIVRLGGGKICLRVDNSLNVLVEPTAASA